jgi:hypothetical protein
MVQELRREYLSLWAAVESMAPKAGCVPQALLGFELPAFLEHSPAVDLGMLYRFNKIHHRQLFLPIDPGIRPPDHRVGSMVGTRLFSLHPIPSTFSGDQTRPFVIDKATQLSTKMVQRSIKSEPSSGGSLIAEASPRSTTTACSPGVKNPSYGLPVLKCVGATC